MKKKPWLLFCCGLLLFLGFMIFFSRRTEPPPQAKPPVVRIGANLELSGRYAEYGQGALNGIRLAIDEINEAGGVSGRPLELVVRDNNSDADASRNAFLQLAHEEKVLAIIGPDVSSCSIAVAPLAEQLETPLLIPWASNPRVTTDDSGRTRAYVFRLCYIDTLQGAAMARFAAEHLTLTRIAILIDSSSPYPLGLGSFFEQSFRQLAGQVTAQTFFTPAEKNWPLLMQEVLAKKPDGLFISAYQKESAQLIKTARSLGFTGPILLSDAWDEPETSNLKPTELNGLYHATQFSFKSSEPSIQDFAARYQAFAGKEPLQTSALAYDATKLLADALLRAGSDDRKKLRAALEATQKYPGISGSISFNEKHNAEKDISIIEIKNGISSVIQKVSAN